MSALMAMALALVLLAGASYAVQRQWREAAAMLFVLAVLLWLVVGP